jgi:S1-C subfamily serine protease
MHRTYILILATVIALVSTGCGLTSPAKNPGSSSPETMLLSKNRLASHRVDIFPGGHGSGVALTHDGYMLTNDHVATAGGSLSVTLWDARAKKWTNVPAKVLYTDPKLDLAVVKVDHRLDHVVTIGWQENIHVGDAIYNVGYPFDLGEIVTRGYVMRMDFSFDDPETPITSNIVADLMNGPGASGSGVYLERTGELIGLMRWASIYTMNGLPVMQLRGIVPVSQIRAFLNSKKAPYYSHDGRLTNRSWDECETEAGEAGTVKCEEPDESDAEPVELDVRPDPPTPPNGNWKYDHRFFEGPNAPGK